MGLACVIISPRVLVMAGRRLRKAVFLGSVCSSVGMASQVLGELIVNRM